MVVQSFKGKKEDLVPNTGLDRTLVQSTKDQRLVVKEGDSDRSDGQHCFEVCRSDFGGK